MRKILGFIIFASLLLNICSFSLADEFDYVREDSEEVKIMRALKIMGDDFSDSAIITRAEAVECILRLKNIASYTSSGLRNFKDISLYDKHYGLTDTAKAMGIIKGSTQGYFRPENSVTCLEAVIMLLRATGYDIIADASGGEISDYIITANKYGFLKDIDASAGNMTFASFAKLLYNSFFIGIVEQTSAGSKESYTITLKTPLSWLDMAMGEGVMTDNEYASILYTVSDFSIGQVVINNIRYRTGNTSPNRFLGYNVEYYFIDNDDSIKELVYVREKDNKVQKYSLDENIYEKGGALYIENDDGREKEIKINSSAPLIANGIAQAMSISRIASAGTTGDLTLINNNKGSGYNVAILNDYSNDVILGYDGVSETLNLRYGGEIAMPKEAFGTCEIIENGFPVQRDALVNGKVISYISYGNGRYFRGIISGNIINDKVLSIEDTFKKKLTGEEKEYYLSGDCHNQSLIKLAETFKFYLNYKGEITDVRLLSEKEYAYILKAKIHKVFNEDVLSAKLFTLSGVKTYDFAEKLLINGERTNLNVSEISDMVISNSTGNLIVYELNKDGEISEIDFCSEKSDDLLSDTDKFVKYKTITTPSVVYNGSMIGGIGGRNAIVFSVPISDNIDEEECSVSGLVRQRWYSNITFYDVGLDGNAKAILLNQAAGASFAGYPEPSVFIETVDTITDSGASAKKLYYYKDGMKSSVIIADKPKCTTLSNSKANYPFENLKFGDIIAFETNNKGELDKFAVFFTGSEDAKSDRAITYGAGVGTSTQYQYISGSLCYFESGTFSIDYNGVFEVFYYTVPVPVYKIDTARKTVYKVDMGTLLPKNYYDKTDKGQRVICCGDRYDLKGVFVYE